MVSARGLAIVVASSAEGLAVAHAPVLLAGDRLRFHLSGASALKSLLSQRQHALVVITGADAYISPDWYGATDQVPTWNYVSVEVEGPVRVLGREETVKLVDDLAAHFEAALAPKVPWTRAKMIPERFEAMLEAIDGYEMRLERLAGTTKLSQNKPREQIDRVAARLAERPDEGSRAVAALMLKAETR